MTRIMFVCHGNICRSPLAEFVMKDLVNKKGLPENFFIASAGVSSEEYGNPIYPPVRRILNKRGIDYGNKTANTVKAKDYENYDYLICMDSSNLRGLSRIIGEDIDNKVFRLLDFTDTPSDVADPWYTGDFAATERDIDNGCNALLEFLLKNEHKK